MDVCSPNNYKKSTDYTCFTFNELVHISKALNKINITKPIKSPLKKSKHELWISIYKRLRQKCSYESCWVDLDFIKNIPDKKVRNIIQYFTFKPKASKNLYNWLSTKDINQILRQYEKKHSSNFIFVGTFPSDLHDFKMSHIKQKRFNAFVFNTDDHTKPGKHWVSVYVDHKKKHIEFFDSLGDNPNKNLKKFLSLFTTYTLFVNQIEHQKGHSNCGLYAIFYIIQRLQNNTMDNINTKIVTDKMMDIFRKEIFI